VTAKYIYSGQTCTAPKRILSTDRFTRPSWNGCGARKAAYRGRPGRSQNRRIPVASDLAVSMIAAQLEDARQKGAEILVGGTIQGNLIFPTVVKNCTDDMLGMREEVFGPVAFTSSFETPEEVVARAKNHKYGLRAAVFGGATARRWPMPCEERPTATRYPTTPSAGSVPSPSMNRVVYRGKVLSL